MAAFDLGGVVTKVVAVGLAMFMVGVAGAQSAPIVDPAASPVRDAARRNWEYGVFVEGGVGLGERSDFSFIMVGGHAGRVLTDEHLSGVLKGNFEYGVEVIPFWQSYTPTFLRITCPAGATSAAQCSAPYSVGGTYTGFSVTPIQLRWNFTSGKKIMPWVQGAGGVLYTTRKYPGGGEFELCRSDDDGVQRGYEPDQLYAAGGRGNALLTSVSGGRLMCRRMRCIYPVRAWATRTRA